MNTNNKTLDSLFNNLSSVYGKDNGMLNSNLFVLMNAYAEVYNDVRRKNSQVKNDTYITSANSQALENNFGSLINFPKPPRLNTLTDGDDIYRFILLSLFQNFLSGSTVATMNNSLDQVLSLLAIDETTDAAVLVNNYSQFRFDSISIELSDRAVQASSGTIVGTATAADFSIVPTGSIYIYDYNDANKTISFSGTVITGITYSISYFRDNTGYQGTNWMNLADRNVVSPSPMNLLDGDVYTYNNPEFSYWWNTYNVDGSGVVIDEFKITEAQSPLIFRLPTESLNFKNPYTGEIVTNSIDVYNLSGTAFDINIVTEYNPDIKFSDAPQNYQTDVSGKYQNYYVRYSENNSYNYTALAKYNGSFVKYVKRLQSIEFPSDNRGTLDFFEKNLTFDTNDLFGTGTKHIWMNVAWDPSGKYVLDNANFLERNYSLHQDIVWKEFFEQDNNARIYYSSPSGIRVTEAPPNTLEGKEDCLSIFSTLTGTSGGVFDTASLYAYPIVTSGVTSYANHLEIDFYDNLNNSGTTSFVDVFRNGPTGEFYQFRFGMTSGTFINVTGDSALAFSLNNTKSFDFVETYFASSGNTEYAVAPTGTPNPTWSLASGNGFTTSSSYSYSGTSAPELIPNLTPAQIISADYFEVQLSPRLSSSKINLGPIFTMQRYTNLGGGLGSRDYFAFNVSNFPSTYFSWNKIDNGVGSAGITSIVVPTGSVNIKLIKNSAIEINGVSYDLNSGAFGLQANHPADFWNKGTLGISAIPAGPTIESYNPDFGNSRSFIFSPGYVQTVQHYVFGNQNLRQDFINKTTPNPWSLTFSSGSFYTPYFYQVATIAGTIDSQPKNYITSVPREGEWHHLTFDFGTSYSGMNASIDETLFLSSNLGYSGNFAYPTAMTVNHSSNQPYTDMSFYDNIEFSYYDKDNILPKYRYQTNPNTNGLAPVVTNDDLWEGSALDVSAVVDNKFFLSEPVSNFQFNVLIQGLDESFIYIVNDIINRVKPAHTLVVPIYLLEQTLDTTEQSIVTDPATDWETGNPYYNIEIVADGTGLGDLSGLIRISGLADS